MRRLLVVAVIVAAVAGFAPRADALPFIPSPCDLAPGGVVADACKAVTDPVGTGAGIVGGAVGGAVNDVTQGVAGNIFDQAMSWLSGMLADAMKSALDGFGAMLSSVPAPPVDQAWFTQEYAPLVGLGVFLCWLTFAVHLVVNWVRFRTAAVYRCFLNCLVAMLGVATAPLFIKMALDLADALTAGLASWGGVAAGQLTDKLSEITGTISTTGGLTGVQPLLVIFLLFLAVLLVLAWAIMLLLRTELIYLGTLAIPFVLPSIIDGRARFARWYSRAMFGLIVAKPILFGTVVAGAYLMQQGGIGGDGIMPLIGGVVIMGAGILLPTVILKAFLPAAGVIVATVERAGHRAVDSVKDIRQKVAVGASAAATGGASTAVMASAAPAKPRTPPPRMPVNVGADA